MFKFDLGQRVNVPHFIGVQGIVTTRLDGIGTENRYSLDWLVDITRSSGSFPESEMLLANGGAARNVWTRVADEPDLAKPADPTPLDELAKLIGGGSRRSKRKPARNKKHKPARKSKRRR